MKNLPGIVGNTCGFKHGHARTITYRVWAAVKSRCINSDYKDYQNYGAKGITICDRWLSFENFLADMGERPSLDYSIDRIDNSKGYEPGNCRWATRSQQQRNKNSNHLLTLGNETKTIAEWAEILKMPWMTLYSRLIKGWSVERALTTPVRPKRKNHA